MGQLGAPGSPLVRPDFLLGLFFQIRTFGLSLEEYRGRFQKQMIKPSGQKERRQSPSQLCLPQDLLKVLQNAFSTREMFRNEPIVIVRQCVKLHIRMSFMFLKYCDNFHYIFGLHINIFHSLANRCF